MTQATPAQRAAAATDPLRRAASIPLTPGQTTSLPFESRAVLLGLGGDLHVTLAGGDSLTLPALREGVLYQARIGLPSNVQTGAYTAETFAVRDGRVMASAVVVIQRVKTAISTLMVNSLLKWVSMN